MAKCSGITQAGTACKGIPIEGSDWCYVHSPDHAEERRRHGSRGGKRGGRGRPQAELLEVKNELREVIEAVRTGKLEKGVGAVVFQGYGVLLKAHAVALDVQERLELLPRLEEIEERMVADKERGQWGA